MKSVLILEDVSETLTWLGEIAVEAFPGCQVTGVSSLRDARSAMDQRVFDLALIDLRLPDGSGLDVLRQLRADCPDTICIVTTAMADDSSIVGALSAGASGYLLKEQMREGIIRQLQQVKEGLPALSPSIARRIMEHFRRTGPAVEETGRLTLREQEVLTLIGRGMRNAEVAAELKLSENTVSGYIKAIYRKLGISSRAEASWHAAQLGLSTREPGK
ncbi:MAG: response regulator transcription factor [Sphingomonadales bacterium]|jgi:DNA-binding NarL/FixJ family response regulator|nr:response regulator transcription factor [Sphingomonadales bacterium]MBK9004919.1 response regulator transcription factor [Sphingomonadales bacterium]MBK9267349.1 response regulator transcription factor [Sphingomonadales bacterium]MBP6434059.1 response regulator transcription factor [Sphingorhabdus sp.]